MINYYFVSFFYREEGKAWNPSRVEFGLDDQTLNSMGMIEAIEKHLMENVYDNEVQIRIIYFKLLRSITEGEPEKKSLLGELPPDVFDQVPHAFNQIPYEDEP